MTSSFSINSLAAIIPKKSINENVRCIRRLILVDTIFPEASIKSFENEVVKEVSAESALEYAAATVPKINGTPTVSGKNSIAN